MQLNKEIYKGRNQTPYPETMNSPKNPQATKKIVKTNYFRLNLEAATKAMLRRKRNYTELWEERRLASNQ